VTKVSQIERRETFFRGHVQGVGFRYTTHSIARGYAVTGFVCNLPDGRVQLVAEGESSELQRFLNEVSDRMGGFIRDTKTGSGAATGAFTSFEIRT